MSPVYTKWGTGYLHINDCVQHSSCTRANIAIAIFAMILLCFCYLIAMLCCDFAMNCYDYVMFRIACCYEKETFGKQGVQEGGR